MNVTEEKQQNGVKGLAQHEGDGEEMRVTARLPAGVAGEGVLALSLEP